MRLTATFCRAIHLNNQITSRTHPGKRLRDFQSCFPSFFADAAPEGLTQFRLDPASSYTASFSGSGTAPTRCTAPRPNPLGW
jgi:hypothetical protein